MNKELSKIYDPHQTEDRLYKLWESQGYFSAEIDKSKKPYTIVMPPPNITGRLHMGHALDQTIQDIIIRYKRMAGYCALWVPGTDHSSIATEAKIVEKMSKEGIKKEDIGREEFLKRAWEWKEEYGSNIVSQLKKLGASCDWSRKRFTLDEGCSKAVREFFVRLYEEGLIYRGEKIINWCPRCCTSISDSEVDFKELDGNFWHIKYPLAGKEGFAEVATTRPETMWGDVALAVNPNDERYKELIGQKARVPIVNREIPIVADEYVDIEMGTGILKITPAHDPNDFEVGLRHDLAIINVMDEKAVMNENAGEYHGMDRYEARKRFVEVLTSAGYINQIKDIRHNVGACYRCGITVEPRISKQWFVKMQPLAKPAIECVKSGEINFVPERFSKTYYHWMENIKDWCISRQLWWGHRIPVWYCHACGENIVSREEEVYICPRCQSHNLTRDEDTLDTWFSSGLWPFSVLGWPENTVEFEYFYPTDVLVTGYDIIFFWVAKMIFSSLKMTNKIPFKHVLIHGLVRDSKGRKMSKSLGNGIDPLEIIEKYGADALRFSLMMGNSPGNDLRFFTEKVEASRNFANKIWNAARFVHLSVDGENISSELPPDLCMSDRWILSRLNEVTAEVSSNIDKFELGVAAQKLYDFIWDEFCDWYIEFSKVLGKKEVLLFVLKSILKLLHPFMPFITEEIWRSFHDDESSLMISRYPQFNSKLIDIDACRSFEVLISVIKSVRNIRREMNVPHHKTTALYAESSNESHLKILKSHKEVVCRFASVNNVEVARSFDIPKAVSEVNDYFKIYIPLGDLVERETEILRLTKELEVSKKQLTQARQRLENKEFISKAPEVIIKGAQEMAEKLQNKVEKLNKSIAEL